MSDIEDALREEMRAHDADGPTAVEFRFRAPDGSRASPWLAAVAAAACALVVATVALVVSNRGNHHAPTPLAKRAPPAAVATHPLSPVPSIRSCPAEIGGRGYWIPQPPKGVDAAKGFVPPDTPTHAIVCAYLHGNRGKLTGTRTLDGNLSMIPADLAELPRAPDGQPCELYYALTDGDYYLMALSYPSGAMWLSIPGNHCVGASNGKLIVANLRAQADAAYRTGDWKR